MVNKHKYGHIKGGIKPEDPLVKFTEEHAKAFRDNKKIDNTGSIFDLRNIVKLPVGLSEINQGQLGSCTANAIAFAYTFDEIKQANKESFFPSRLFIYYNERMIEGTVNEDSGAQIRDGIKSINTYGVCDEHLWVYDPTKFAVKPSDLAYNEAKNAKAINYASIDLSNDKTPDARVNHLKLALKSGFPFVFGFIVFESFESEQVAQTGIMPLPKPNEQIVGGHAVCAVGFDDTKKSFIIKNSWGPNWGDHGYFYMPYDFIGVDELASDFWVIKQVTNPDIQGFTPQDINPDAVNLYA